MKTIILRVLFALLPLLLPLSVQAQVVDSLGLHVNNKGNVGGLQGEPSDVAVDTVETDTAVADTAVDFGRGYSDGLNNVDFQVNVPDHWTMSYSDSLSYNYLFQQAVALFSQQHDAAFDLLTQCLHLNPRAPEVYYYLAVYYGYLGNDSIMEESMKAAVGLDPSNTYFLTGLLNAYNKDGKFEESVKVAEDILAKSDDKLPVLQVLVNLYYNTDQNDKVLETLDKIELLGGGSDELTLARAQLLEEMGRHKKARQVYDELIEKNPNDESFRLKLGNYLVSRKKFSEAKKIFDAVVKDDPESPEAQLSMLSYYRAVGDSVKENDERVKLLLNKRTPEQTRQGILQLQLVFALTDSTQHEPVMQLIDTLLSYDPANTQFLLTKGQLLGSDSTKMAEARECFAKVVELEPGNLQALQYLIAASLPNDSMTKEERDSTWRHLIVLAKQGAQYNPSESWFYDVWGQGGYELKEYQTTVDAYRTALNHRSKEWKDERISDLYGMMGDMLHELGKEPEAFAAYDSSLVWNESNYPVLNNYAYYLSLKNRDLDRAARMALKAVNGEPNNANSIDTYAWVLFMQKKYDDARGFIDLALQVDTDTVDNSTLLEHAGDIYMMCGLTDEAVDFWQKALKKKKGDALLEKKIREKKVYLRKEE
ncbi:MAG: tetratricopeptide repeat protein [Prevotella sp.]|jgi:tetratricopeptide (TPR) repeat protein